MISGRRSLARIRAVEAGEVIELDREHLLSLVQNDYELGEIIMRAYILRRVGLIDGHMGDAIVAGSMQCSQTLRIREFLSRNGHPYQFIDLALSREIQEQLVATFKAGPTNLKAAVPATLRGQPGVFVTPSEWKERGYIMDDETRATSLPAWKEWFNASIVAK